MFDPATFRQVLGHFPTGVVVIAADGAEGPVGMSIGSFGSVSLDPPLVGFFCGKTSSTWTKVESAGKFAVNILADDQEHLSRLFASKTQDKFEGLGWHKSALGSPILDGVVAWIDCDIHQVLDAGDHWCVLGKVSDLAVANEGTPLVFYRGGYGSFHQ